MVKLVYFNPDKPLNQTIRKVNKKTYRLNVYGEVELKVLFNDIICKLCSHVQQMYDKVQAPGLCQTFKKFMYIVLGSLAYPPGGTHINRANSS